MNSIERRELRYQRRKAKRKADNVSIDVFCFSKVMYYADKCCKGVGYKKSRKILNYIYLLILLQLVII